MYRGTTPTLNFIFEYNLENFDITAFYLTFMQGNEIVLEKELSELEITENTVTVKLTQQETLSMESNEPIYIQARIKIKDVAYATNIIATNLKSILKGGVI